MKISLYGNFGAGNLGNECTLQAVIERILACRPDAELQCLCADPADVRQRHGIPAVRASMRGATETVPPGSGSDLPASALARGTAGPHVKLMRLLSRRIPLEIAHWLKMMRALRGTDMLIVAGTGIVADYMCGPLGWPYDMFKLAIVARLCGVRMAFLSVGVGPISHPLSRWFIKTSLRLARFRSYRDETSRQYLERIGFDAGGDAVYPDVVFGLSESHLSCTTGRTGAKRIVGLGLKDYSGVIGRLETEEYRRYLDVMAAFVSWLHTRGYGVRLLIGDMQYDGPVIDEFVDLLRRREVPVPAAAPARSVDDLLCQLRETDVVISARYHNLVMGMILGKPVIALSDHAKLDAVVTDLGLARYLVPLAGLRSDVLASRFQDLERDIGRLEAQIRDRLGEYRRALDEQYASLLAPSAFRPT